VKQLPFREAEGFLQDSASIRFSAMGDIPIVPLGFGIVRPEDVMGPLPMDPAFSRKLDDREGNQGK
jgi:hypothetical protein